MADTDPGPFPPTFPCWVLVRGDSVAGSAGGGVRAVGPLIFSVMRDDAGTLAVPVFTDEGSADRYREASGLPGGVVPLRLETPARLAGALGSARQGGVGRVVFDPPRATGRFPRAWEIGHVIDRLRAAR